MKNTINIILIILLLPFAILGQTTDLDYSNLESSLAQYALEYPKINKTIDVSITGSIQEFAIAFSKETKLNLIVDPLIDVKVATNFSQTKPQDILLHMCKFYNLNLNFSGSIISLIPREGPKVIENIKPLEINYNSFNEKIELKLNGDTLDVVLKKISQLTNKNVIATKAASQTILGGYIGNTDLENALSLLAERNELMFTKNDKGSYIFDIKGKKAVASSSKTARGNKDPKKAKAIASEFKVKLNIDSLGNNVLTLAAEQAVIGDLLKDVSKQMGKNYFLLQEPPEKITLNLTNASYDDFLETILDGSAYSYSQSNGIYIIGEKTSSGIQQYQVFQLQYRSVENLIDVIPTQLKENIEVVEFVELNSLILSGPAKGVAEVGDFLHTIDKAVPVVMIELLIVDVQENRETRLGVTAGIGENPTTSGGSIFPDVNFTFSAGGINQLLNLLSGNGIVNLGQVRPNFYASLQAVEDEGHAIVRSKPRLSTLNGQEASLSIGETRYYLDQRTTLQGNQSPISIQDRNYRPVNADFSITILPIVSGNEHVTLKIDVSQSDFIGQVQNDAPPAQVNRTFNSNIRIKNGEMIVLGGLESKSVENSGTGIPVLARIPVLKWFFSNRRKAKSKSKLLLFVKPTIMY